MEVILLFGKVFSGFLSVILVFGFSLSALAPSATPSDALMEGRLPVASGADASELDASFFVAPLKDVANCYAAISGISPIKL